MREKKKALVPIILITQSAVYQMHSKKHFFCMDHLYSKQPCPHYDGQ